MRSRKLTLPKIPFLLTSILFLALIFGLTVQVLADPRTEIVEERTLTTKTFDNGDGTFTFEAHGGHIHYVDQATGKLEECDTTLVDAGGKWVQSKASYHSEFPKYADGEFAFIDVFEDKNQTVVMRPLAQHILGEIDNSDGWVNKRILYRNAYGEGLHLRVTAGNVGLFKEIIIDDKPEPLRDLSFDFEITLPSEDHVYIQYDETEGSLRLASLDNLILTNNQQLLIGQEPIGKKPFSRIQKIRVWDSEGEAIHGRLQFYRKGSKLYFKKIVPKEFLAKATYPVYTDDEETFDEGTGDGYVQKANTLDWDTNHDATTGSASSSTLTNSFFSRTGRDASNNYIITRAFFPFNTEPLSDSAIIIAATLSLYVDSKQNIDNDGEDFEVVVQTTQPSTSALTTADFALCGSVHSPVEGSNRVDITNVVINQYIVWTLNATGLGWISKTDWTKLGMREGHDVLDHTIVAGTSQKNRINGYYADQTGTTYDPKLSITYSLPHTVSGRLYSDEGATPITGTAKTVSLWVNGSDSYTAETNTSDGTYSISDVYMISGDVVTVFLNDETEKAVTVTRSAGSDISGLDLYQNRVIVRHEDAGPITNANLGQYDKDNDDTDIHFTSNSNSLTVDNDHELHVWTGDSFSPAGPVTTSSGGTSPGSDIHIHINATFTAGGAISCGGSWTADSGSNFTHNSNTVTFTATASGKTIASNGQSFYDLTFDGNNGGWTFQDNVDVDNNLTITSGTNRTVTGPSSGTINVGNNWDVSGGTFTHNDSEVIFDATDSGNTITSGSNGTFYDLTFNDGGNNGVWTFQDNVDVDNNLTITDGTVTGPSSGTINVGNNWDVSGGTFTHNDSEVIFDATDSGNTITSGSNGTFYDLTFNGAGGGWTFQDNVDVDNNLSIYNGQVTAPSGGTITVGRNWYNSATFNHNDATVTFDGIGQSDITGTTTFYDLTVDTNADGARTLRFGAGEEQTVAHSLTLMGYLGKVLTIRSTIDGTKALLTLQGGASQSMDYLDVQDNDASNGQALEVHHCTHSNTTNWTFGVLGEIDHHYQIHDAVITKSCSNSNWDEVTEYKIASNNFSAGNKYLIVINFSISMSDADANAMARVLHGTTVFPDSTYRWESRRSSESHCGHGYHYWTVWTAVQNEDIHIEVTQPSATYNVYTEEYEAFVIDLSEDLTEGTHWFDNTATHSGYLPTSWSDGASITFDGSNNDWLVLGFGRFDTPGATTARYKMQIRNDTTDYSKVEYGVVDANDYRPHMIMVRLTDVGSNNTVKVQAAATTASRHSWSDSKIFALNLNKFKDHSTGYSTSAVTLDGLDSWKEVYGNSSYSASQTGNVLIWSQEVYDVVGGGRASYSRIQVDGSTVPANHEDAKRELPHSNADENAHHRIYSGPLNAGSRYISIDMNEDLVTGASIDIHSLVIFSMELATITVSGTLYSNEAQTPITGTAKTVSLRVNGAGSYTAETNTGDGTYSISDILTAPGDVITVFLDDEDEKAVTVTRSAGADISDLDLYQNRVIVRHEDAGPITNANLGQYDKDNDDTDIHFTSNSNSLVVDNDHELHVWTGDSFSPAGPVTTSSGGTSPGSDIHIHTNATFTAGGAISCGGSWTAESGSTFTHNSNAVTFAATATGKTITTNGQSFYDATFNGVGGGWTFQDDVDVDNNLSIYNGQVTAPSGGTITVGRNWDNSATFNHNDGTVTFDGTVAQQVTTGGSDWNAIEITNASGSVIFADGFTCATFTDTTAGSTLYFRAGETATITGDGGLTLTGALGNLITLRRYLGSGTDQWEIYPQRGNWNVSYVDVKDSSNLHDTYIIRPTNSTDSDNNTMWFADTTVKFGDNSVDHFTGKVQDAHINERSAYQTYNYGGLTNMAVGDPELTARSRRTLIRFMDIDSIGAGKVITSARMYLWCNNEDQASPYSISAYRVLLDWGEGNTQGGQSQSGDSCWDYAKYTGTPWNAEGCSGEGTDRSATALDSETINGDAQYYWWDLTSAAQNWYLGPGSGGWSEYGVILINDSEDTPYSRKSFRSSENSNDGQLPYLEVTYRTGYTVSGTVYSDEGTTPMTGTARTVSLKLNGDGDYTAETNIGDGTFSISSVPFQAGDVITVYLDGETEKAVTVTRSTDADISGLDLYQDRVIVRHEDGGPITNTNLGQYDKDDNTDIHFTSNGTLTVDNDHELHVWTGESFSPGGAVTTSSGGTSPGGDVHIDGTATFTAGGAISCGGSWTADTGATFSHNNGTVTFSGTGAQTVTSGGSNWNNITITNASAGGVTFADSFTCVTFTDTTAGSTLYFKYDETATITDSGGLILTGADGSLITLRRYLGSGSQQWRIDPDGGNWSVSYVDVQDSMNLHDDDINPSDSYDSGNNTKWFQKAYVDKASSNPVYPYVSWGNAANNIQAGIDATSAEDSETVIVRAGTYDENITMTDGVNVVSETTVEPLIVGDGTDYVVTFDGAFTTGCTLDGFDISGGGTYPGIYVHATTGNEITNSTIITNCLIHGNNNGPGIRLAGSDATTAPTIDDNEIYSNGEEGIEILDTGSASENAVILNNLIHDNTLAGIYIEGTSYVTIGDNNVIYSNGGAGIATGGTGYELLSGSSVTIKGNTVGGSGQSNGGAGMYLKGSGSSIQLTIGGSLAADSNTIFYNTEAGISLEGIDQASIENNEISYNSEDGILLIDVSTVSPHIKNNNIHHHVNGDEAGINIGGGSSVMIGDNNDINNNYAGIAFDSGDTNPSSQPVAIEGNLIHDNSYAGISVKDAITGKVTISEENDIYLNDRGGISIQNSCELDIIENKIRDNARGGIHTGTHEENGGGFSGSTGSAVLTIKKNKVYGNGESSYGGGIDVRHASGTIYNNLVYENYRGGIRFGDYITEIIHNTVADNGQSSLGGGIIYDDLAGAVNDEPEGTLTGSPNFPPDPLIRNNISAFNVKTGLRVGKNPSGLTSCPDNPDRDDPNLGDKYRDYNLLYSNNGTGATNCGWYRDSGISYVLILSCANKQYGACGADWPYPFAMEGPNDIIADPLFVDAEYHLDNNSPAKTGGAGGVEMGAHGGSDPITW